MNLLPTLNRHAGTTRAAPSVRGRGGFTLVELLVVAVLGSLILMATYSVLITNQRAYLVNAANMQNQQTVRAGMEVLFAELREISPAGGDLLEMGDQSVKIRVMRATGIVCDSTRPGSGDPLRWGVVHFGDTFRASDTVWAFAEHNTTTTADDVWFASPIQQLHSPTTCGGFTTQRVRLTALAADTPAIGSLMRAYETYTYSLGSYAGKPYLIRTEPSGTAVPLVGPLTAGTGVSFEYLDSSGNTTSVGTDVRQIAVTLRTQHEARNLRGEPIVDSLRTTIFTRN